MVKYFGLLIDAPVYAWLYLRISVHSGRVWGPVADLASNNERLRNMYPKEWKQLQDIRGRYA